MSAEHARRRGFMMILVLSVMGLLLGILSVFAHVTVGMHVGYKHERVRLTADMLVESGVAWVRGQAGAWDGEVPVDPVELDVAALLGPGMNGTVTVRVEPAEGGLTCSIDAAATRRGYRIQQQRVLLLGK